MNTIEQAREALENYGDNPDAVRIIDAGYKALDYDRAMAISKHDVWTILKGSLAALSPSTPVDGVGAEQFVGSCISCNGTGDQGGNPSYGACEDCEGSGLFALANPEAEARLRERVEPSWRAGQYAHPGDKNAFKWLVFCDAWQTSIASGLTKEAAEEIARAHNDALTEAAEARLAQAEGGPAVTEAMVKLAEEVRLNHHRSRDLSYTTDAMRAALEAALHPQSAAGEEGK